MSYLNNIIHTMILASRFFVMGCFLLFGCFLGAGLLVFYRSPMGLFKLLYPPLSLPLIFFVLILRIIKYFRRFLYRCGCKWICIKFFFVVVYLYNITIYKKPSKNIQFSRFVKTLVSLDGYGSVFLLQFFIFSYLNLAYN